MRISASERMIKCLVTISLLFSFIRSDAQNQGPPPTVLYLIEGIRVIRPNLIKQITKFDSTMVFKQISNVDGLPNFTGTDQFRGSLQLVGDEHNIVLAKWTFAFADEKVNMPELTNMGHFAFIIAGQPCVNWLIEKINAVAKDHSHAFTEDKIFFDDVIKGHMNFDPTTFTLALSFTPNKKDR